ncbi:unnamed protein product, partial [marine sediment metagenome]
DLQDLINNTMSAGRTSGGLIESSGVAGDIKVNLGTGFIKTTDSPIGLTRSFNWVDTVIVKGALPGNIIDKETNYIFIAYLPGSTGTLYPSVGYPVTAGIVIPSG